MHEKPDVIQYLGAVRLLHATSPSHLPKALPRAPARILHRFASQKEHSVVNNDTSRI